MRLTRSQQLTEVDAKIAKHATYSVGDALQPRMTLEEDLLPTERALLREHDDFDLSKYQTTSFNILTRRLKPPSSPVVFKIGDTVQVKGITDQPIIAVVVSFHKVSNDSQSTVESELDISPFKAAVHRFELAGSTKVIRTMRPHVQNEVYYLVKDALLVDVSSILRHCTVKKKSNERSDDPLEYCIDSSYDPVTGVYYPMKWDEFHRDKSTTYQNDRVGLWNITISPQKRRNAQEEDSPSSSDASEAKNPEILENESDTEPEDDILEEEESKSNVEFGNSEDDATFKGKAPSKKRKRPNHDTHMRTPSKKRRNITEPTPHSKAALRARKKFKIRPPTILTQDNEALLAMEDDPFIRAMYTLHVGERPDTLPCRDEEYVTIFENVLSLLQESSGGCIYVSGVPGTGKTATIHTIIRELKAMAENNECNPFTFVEINGLRVPEPNAAYPLLWEALIGHDAASKGHLKISPKEAHRRLSLHFGVGGSEISGPACIVLMDELDQLVTTKQDVVYNFFNWPNLTGSKLIVLAVANTHDLPERTLNAKVRSRLGMVRINFSPYTKAQLGEIVNSRLRRAQEGAMNVQPVLKPDAIMYAATRIGGVSGDARRVLDICRRTVERVRSKGRAAGIPDVMQVISLTQNTPTAGYVAQCSFHEKVMLAAALMEVRWTGVEEFTWSKLRSRHIGLLQQLDASEKHPRDEELSGVLDALVHSGLLSIESGAIANRKTLADRKVVMTVEKQEVKRVLVETGQRWHAILGVDT